MPPETRNSDQPTKDLAGKPVSHRSNQGKSGFSSSMSSPGAKFILLGLITIALLVPTLMVWGVVEERKQRAATVAREIAKGWGSPQTLNGPYLIMPYRKYKKVAVTGFEKIEYEEKYDTFHAVISPEVLNIEGEVDVNERKKSIYKTQLYNLQSKISGQFSKDYLEAIKAEGGVPNLDEAFLVVGLSDPSGFRSELAIKVDDAKARKFLPGLKQLGYKQTHKKRVSQFPVRNGVHVPIKADEAKNGFEFQIAMALNGSRKLSFSPAGKTTKLNINSNWPHPGFDGKFLPEKREITKEGFSATWTIPNLARGIDGIYLNANLPPIGTLLEINFVEPLSFYQITSRSLKYAVGVFSLVFLAVFVLEFLGSSRLHFVQYILTGLAMVIFYILLLALAEQVGFLIAYVCASVATTLLIAWYIGDALASKNGSLVVGGVMSTTYLILYLTLNEETYALLAGSLIAFIAIAATMFATRKIDWAGST